MVIPGALIIKLQELNAVLTHPNHAVQSKQNWLTIRPLGATKGSRVSNPHKGSDPKSSTEFNIPDAKVGDAFKLLGILK
jgi:hypothetical protein